MDVTGPFTQSIAVVIGINEYRAPLRVLQTAVNDARELGRILREEHAYDHVIELFDAEASRSRISDLLSRELPAMVGPDDRVLFYFAGHGVSRDGQDGPNGYLMPTDAIPKDIATQLHMPWLHDALTALPCRHMFIVLDACFSGAFRWSATRCGEPEDNDEVTLERYERFVRDPAWQVLTSASSSEEANDLLTGSDIGTRYAAGKHSPFAAALFAALRGEADVIPVGTGDGLVTASELFAFVMDRVVDRSDQAKRRQTPSYWPLRKHGRGEYLFFVPGKSPTLKPAPPLSFEDNPWRGLESYDAADRKQFYGRDDEIERMVAQVRSCPFSVVLGASGTGKSSLVKAGVLPRLTDDGWHVLPVIRPDASPFSSLQRALAPSSQVTATMTAATATALHATAPADSSVQARNLAERAAQIREQLAAVLSEHHTPGVVLLVDQFEELLTQVRDKSERQAFLALLASLVREHGERLRVIVTLRSDFKPNFDDAELFGEPWRAGQYVVPPMSREDLRAVIERPATTRVLYFEPPALVEKLVDEVVATPGALPLLSFALSEMYIGYVKRQNVDQRMGKRTDRSITQTDFDVLGGVVGALRARADAEYGALSAEEQATAQRLLLRMVSAEGGNLARRRVDDAELVFPTDDENVRVQAVVSRLTAARLLVRGERDGVRFVEPAHDALVRGWVKLIEWVREAADAPVPLTTRQKLAVAAAEWDAAEKVAKAGLLWSDPVRGALLRPEVNQQAPWMNDRELRFAKRSVRGGTIARWVRIGTTAVIAVAAAVAVGQRNQATQAADAANEQVARAYLLDASDTTLTDIQAAANAAAAVAAAPDPRMASSGLLLHLVRVGLPLLELEHSPLVDQMEWSPDSRAIVTSGIDSAVRTWDASSGRQIGATLRHRGAIRSVAFSHDGKEILTASDDGTASLWEFGAGRVLFSLRGTHVGVERAEFSRDGRRILTLHSDGSSREWDAQTGSPLGAAVPQAGYRRGARILAVWYDTTRALVLQTVSGRVWASDALTGAMLHEYVMTAEDRFRINAAEFSSDGTMVVMASDNQTAWIWSTSTWRPIGTPLRHDYVVVSARFDHTGARVVTASWDKTARVWATATSQPIGAPMRHRQEVLSAEFSADGERIVTASADSTVALWSAMTGTALRSAFTHDAEVSFARFSPDGRHVAAGGGWMPAERDGSEKVNLGLRRYLVYRQGGDSSKASLVRVWRAPAGLPGPVPVRGWLKVSRDGGRFLTSPGHDTLQMLDARTGSVVGPRFVEAGFVNAFLSADGHYVATVTDSQSGHLWRVETGEAIGSLPFDSVDFSDDGTRVVGMNQETSLVEIRDTRNAEPIVIVDEELSTQLLEQEELRSAYRSAVGYLIDRMTLRLFVGHEHIRSFSLATGELLSEIGAFPDSLRYIGHMLVYSQAAGVIATTANGVETAVWEVASGRHLYDLFGLEALMLSPNGRLLVPAYMSHPTVRPVRTHVLDARTGEALFPPLQHNDNPGLPQFSANGSLFLTQVDGAARVWESASGTPVSAPIASASGIFVADGRRFAVSDAHRVWLLETQGGRRLGLPLASPGPVRLIGLDSTRLVGVPPDSVALVWDIRQVEPKHRSDLVDLAELIVGGRMRGPRDFVTGVKDRFSRLQAWRKRAAGWANAPDGSFEQWVHWYFSDPATRPNQPGLWRSAPVKQ